MLQETQTFYLDLIEAVKDQRLKQSFKYAFMKAIDQVEGTLTERKLRT